MTNEEFSNEFDLLASTYSTTKSFGVDSTLLGFDEYEKSLFLTQAQESIVIALYNGNLTGDSFEKTEELRRYLNNLIKTYSTNNEVSGDGLTENSQLFSIPDDTWFITYESALVTNGQSKSKTLVVVPITQDEFHRIKDNPFRGANNRRALRLDAGESVIEIVSAYEISEYQMRYLSRPEPIILIDLPEGLSINGETQQTECKLNPAIHRVILERAVSLALKSRANAGK